MNQDKSIMYQYKLENIYQVFQNILKEENSLDYSFQAYGLELPSEFSLAQDAKESIDPVAIRKARLQLTKLLAHRFDKDIKMHFYKLTDDMTRQEFKIDRISIGKRRLRNILLHYLCYIRHTHEEQVMAENIAMIHYNNATEMSDKLASLRELNNMEESYTPNYDVALIFF